MSAREVTTYAMTRYGSTSGYHKMSVQGGADDRASGEDETQDSAPISFADMGIPTGPQLQNTALGTSRRVSDLERREWAFLAVSIAALLATLVMTIIKLATISKDDPDFTFALVLLLNTVFCLFYVLHGVLLERPYEIFIFFIATCIVVLYIIVNFATSSKKDTLKIVRLVVTCVLGPVMIGLGGWIGWDYLIAGRLVFRTIGANMHLQTACKLLYLFLSLLKLDLQLAMSTVIFILNNGATPNTEEIVVLTIGCVLCLAVFAMGNLATRFESKWGTIAFFILCPFQIAYVIYKIVESAQDLNGQTESLAISTFVCSGLSILARVLVFIVGIFVFRNFNQGLKDKVFARTSNSSN